MGASCRSPWKRESSWSDVLPRTRVLPTVSVASFIGHDMCSDYLTDRLMS